VGSKFGNSTVKQVLFMDCNFSYSNFEHSKFQKVILQKSNFTNACLAEGILQEMEWKDVVLNNCDFFKTPLKKMDFRECQIDGIMISDTHKELEGVIVDTYQAAALARFLGVVIK
jgi:uncharacterized protein YjbI with pentapeptide repeats